jgi:hypothetical protein
MRWAGHVAHMEERRVPGVLVGKPEGKWTSERSMHSWEDNIKKDHQEVVWGHRLHWCSSGQGQVANCCECGNEPSGYIKCGKFLDWKPPSFSRKTLLHRACLLHYTHTFVEWASFYIRGMCFVDHIMWPQYNRTVAWKLLGHCRRKDSQK